MNSPTGATSLARLAATKGNLAAGRPGHASEDVHPQSSPLAPIRVARCRSQDAARCVRARRMPNADDFGCELGILKAKAESRGQSELVITSSEVHPMPGMPGDGSPDAGLLQRDWQEMSAGDRTVSRADVPR